MFRCSVAEQILRVSGGKEGAQANLALRSLRSQSSEWRPQTAPRELCCMGTEVMCLYAVHLRRPGGRGRQLHRLKVWL